MEVKEKAKKTKKTKKVEEVKQIETKEEDVKVEVVQEEAKEEVKERKGKKNKKEELSLEKQEKRERAKREVKAFFILLFLILAIGGGTWYWYTYKYDANRTQKRKDKTKEENKQEEEKKDISYKIDSYESKHHLHLVGERFIVEYDTEYIYKVMDTDLNVLFDGKQEYDKYFYGNGGFYMYLEQRGESENNIDLYQLEADEFELYTSIMHYGVMYEPLLTGEKEEELIGFVGSYDKTLDLDEQDIELNNYVYLFGEDDIELGNYFPYGDDPSNLFKQCYVKDSKYLIISEEAKGKTKYGVFDLEEQKVIIAPTYDDLYLGYKGAFVVVSDGKVGIIDEKLKKKVDYKYDYITPSDGYYIVGTDEKLAIMDDNFKIITELDFVRKDHLPIYGTRFTEIKLYKINDKLVLETYDQPIYSTVQKLLHEIKLYVIDKEGTYETVDLNLFSYDKVTGLAYGYVAEDKEYYIFNDDMEEKFTVVVSDYDFKTVPKLRLLNKDTLVIETLNPIYIDYNTSADIEDVKDLAFADGEFKILYDDKNNKLTVEAGGQKKEYKMYSFDVDYELHKKIGEENRYFIINDDLVISINEVEE